MPVVAFTGTSTGNVYNVGQSYESAGRVYTAQADGSFSTTNSDGTTRSVVGSSQSETATFYTSSSSGSNGSNGSGGSRPALSTPQGGGVSGSPGRPSSSVAAAPNVGSGPGVKAVASGVASAAGANQFSEWFAKNGFSPNLMFVQRTDGSYDAAMVEYEVVPGATLRSTMYYANGVPLPMDPTTSDVADLQQRFGDDNPLVSTVGAGYVGGTSVGAMLQGNTAFSGAAPGSMSAWSAPQQALPTNQSAWAVGNGIR